MCLTALNKQDYPAKAQFKTRYREVSVIRPVTAKGHQGILSWEIYVKPTNPPERETVDALNALVDEGEAILFFSREFLWYAKA